MSWVLYRNDLHEWSRYDVKFERETGKRQPGNRGKRPRLYWQRKDKGGGSNGASSQQKGSEDSSSKKSQSDAAKK